MTANIEQLRRQADALEEAEGLLTELNSKAIFLEDYNQKMVELETAHRDLPVITGARMDPGGEGHLIAKALAEVRRKLVDLDGGKQG